MLDSFAPAAFHEMADQDKLKAAAYEQLPSGVQASGDQELRTDHILLWPVVYEMLVQDKSVDPNPVPALSYPNRRCALSSSFQEESWGDLLSQPHGPVYEKKTESTPEAFRSAMPSQALMICGRSARMVVPRIRITSSTVAQFTRPDCCLGAVRQRRGVQRWCQPDRLAHLLEIIPEAQLAA